MSTVPITLEVFPSSNTSTAFAPIFEAKIVSKALGLPPLWICPKTVALVSIPVTSSTSLANSNAPPIPSAKRTRLCIFPFCFPSRIVLHNSFLSNPFSGVIIASAPPAKPAYKAISPQFLPITSTIDTLSCDVEVSLILLIASKTVFRAVSNPIV